MVPKLGLEQGEGDSEVWDPVVQDLGVLLGLLCHVSTDTAPQSRN